MKTNFAVSFSMFFLSASLFLVACNKPEEAAVPASTPKPAAAAAPTSSETPKQAADAAAPAEPVPTETAKAVEATKPAETAAPAPPAPSSAVSQTEAVFKQAKTLMGQKKYTEALAALSQLSNVSLSPEEQKAVEQLKGQIETAMASQGANEGLKAAGGLLKK